ncbi:MAG TPA: hypothetical protein VL175_20325 [Pirellulales bacterium]|nr:hypothetical protein [Pirellulales bacterium]
MSGTGGATGAGVIGLPVGGSTGGNSSAGIGCTGAGVGRYEGVGAGAGALGAGYESVGAGWYVPLTAGLDDPQSDPLYTSPQQATGAHWTL